MKSKAFIFLAFAILACGPTQSKKEKTVAESIVEKMESRFNATSFTVVESDEMYRGQGVFRTLTVEFIGCKSIDLMDSALKPEIKAMVQELKNNISGSDRIKKYKIVLLKDPNDTTPIKSGFNVAEKGFTYNREDLN